MFIYLAGVKKKNVLILWEMKHLQQAEDLGYSDYESGEFRLKEAVI